MKLTQASVYFASSPRD